jgi:hypothetical protein
MGAELYRIDTTLSLEPSCSFEELSNFRVPLAGCEAANLALLGSIF